jgi:5-methylcytosine-specific restriction endonuclease McrA
MGERRQLLDLYERDIGLCWLCGEHVPHPYWEAEEINDVNAPTRDHVIPKSRGGKNTLDNLRLAHSLCNRLRGNQ